MFLTVVNLPLFSLQHNGMHKVKMLIDDWCNPENRERAIHRYSK